MFSLVTLNMLYRAPSLMLCNPVSRKLRELEPSRTAYIPTIMDWNARCDGIRERKYVLIEKDSEIPAKFVVFCRTLWALIFHVEDLTDQAAGAECQNSIILVWIDRVPQYKVTVSEILEKIWKRHKINKFFGMLQWNGGFFPPKAM